MGKGSSHLPNFQSPTINETFIADFWHCERKAFKILDLIRPTSSAAVRQELEQARRPRSLSAERARLLYRLSREATAREVEFLGLFWLGSYGFWMVLERLMHLARKKKLACCHCNACFFGGDLRGVINLASWWLGKGSRTKDTPLGQENRCWMDNDVGYHEMNCLSSISLSCMFWRVQVAISQGPQCLPMVMLLVLTCLYSIEKNTLQCGKVGNVQLCLAHVPACSKYTLSKMNWPVI